MPLEEKLHGSLTALVTPFSDQDQLDLDAFAALVDWQIRQGSNGLVPCGTTGESSTLSHEEHHQVITACIRAASKRVPVIAGAGSNSTREAITLCRHAEKSGADALLLVTPYYNKPNQEGLYAHFRALHDSCRLPIILYDIPGRSVIGLDDSCLKRLAALPRIIALKDATADIARPARLIPQIKESFVFLSGEDATALAYRAAGGRGCISVTSNLLPAACANMHAAWQNGDVARAQDLDQRLQPFHGALFREPNPQPLKAALALEGRCQNILRLPLRPAAAACQDELSRLLKNQP